ncbi:hypothetical protein [Microbacterium rhizomatis]|uniref:Uncharacterized protein n=1 Tax=Microbacterium rhizomatis TaxID=1631477 RepID=A0A5J5J7R9_9MICO|nr:hypothetical protein [Microbacterium rhizomatis]KAA9111519.1 hypothetical protein F6B43_08130 [Microbacterium rhizomatis]
MSNERDLPEGVIDADPPGGWESEEAADRETAAANADAIESASLISSGLPPLTPEGSDATADSDESDGSVEDAAMSAGVDPDLRTDADVDEAP